LLSTLLGISPEFGELCTIPNPRPRVPNCGASVQIGGQVFCLAELSNELR